MRCRDADDGIGVGEAAVGAEVGCLLEPLQVGRVLDSGEVRVVGPLVAEPVGSAHEEVDEVVEVGVGVGEGPGQPGGRARARARQIWFGRVRLSEVGRPGSREQHPGPAHGSGPLFGGVGPPA